MTEKTQPVGTTEKRPEEKESKKTFWQMVGFLLVSSIASVIQLVSVNVLLALMRSWKAPLPSFMNGIFNTTTVGAGNDNWGYVLPFFLSNMLANIYGYIQNRKTTFKSNAPAWCFYVYIVILVALILFSTWLQGIVVHALDLTGNALITKFAPTIAAALAGFIQMLVLFPLEKFVLFRKRDTGKL